MSRSGINNKGGRPKGKRSKATLEKERIFAHLRQRIMRSADLIFDAQLSIARGIQFLYKIEKEFIRTGTNRKTGEVIGWWKNKKPVLVENEEEIRAYIEGLHVEGDADNLNDQSATYYFITVKEPNNNAIDSMFDRVFGKAKQSVDLTSDGKRLPTPIYNGLSTEKTNGDITPTVIAPDQVIQLPEHHGDQKDIQAQ